VAGAITITGLDTFKDQSGDLSLILPSTTDRPVNYFNVPRWWWNGDNTIYEGCVRVDNSANNQSVYVSVTDINPHLKIEWDGSTYSSDSDRKRKYVDRIFITSDAALKVGTDYRVPLRGAAITAVS
jgi:hypothetical protein